MRSTPAVCQHGTIGVQGLGIRLDLPQRGNVRAEMTHKKGVAEQRNFLCEGGCLVLGGHLLRRTAAAAILAAAGGRTARDSVPRSVRHGPTCRAIVTCWDAG